MTSEVCGIIPILITLIITVTRLARGQSIFYFLAVGKLREGKYIEMGSCDPNEGHRITTLSGLGGTSRII